MEEDNIEIWKPIPSFDERYRISNFGNLRGVRGQIIKGRIKAGYRYTSLQSDRGEVEVRIHQLVAMAFLDHFPDGTTKIVVDHIDNDQSNNHVSNLQIITNRENSSKDKKNKTGYTGVGLKSSGRFEANLGVGEIKIYLGTFATAKEASLFRQKALENLDQYDGDSKKFRNFIKEKAA